ncbi:hypothetical protein EMCG_09561 [[Emmonsia] crescens]|uniref:EH domain-containing protein n=1 Tax=[Emmonsia] crescens TaxID=73230 RepID=A0A0G2I2R1_9EURO|nr:hypothetical protein EMCG_09561 [Emmonsia crescens UAMH 3008]
MLRKGLKCTVSALGTVLILLLTAAIFRRGLLTTSSSLPRVPQEQDDVAPKGANGNEHDSISVSTPDTAPIAPSSDVFGLLEGEMSERYRQIFSTSTADKKYFLIQFGELEAINPSIIPHPGLENTWIIVAQQQRSSVPNSVWFAELVCNAVFKDGSLQCIQPPVILPIAATPSTAGKCVDELEYFSFSIGPHDARVFYGPNAAYTVYGSNSEYTCFGQWIHDFRVLVDWGYEPFGSNEFRKATEIWRPAPYGLIEKNWFVFWDKHGQMYVHYDIAPKRAFAKLEFSGTVSEDLAPLAISNDEKCMEKYMPKVALELESIHQATNLLSITLCKREDPTCEPNDSNTFIFTIFQHKAFYSFHSIYEPYVMLFKQTTPFGIHGVSTKPLWIHGRGKPGQGKKPAKLTPQAAQSWSQTEMFYVTSMSWKTHGQRYHGYIDDVLFIGFGIEDSKTAGVDTVAGNLLLDLSLCSAS